MDEMYPAKVIDHFLDDIKGSIGRIEENTNEIKREAKLTNGRVKSLEKWRAGIKVGITVFVSVVFPLIAVLFWIVYDQIKDINKTLSTYELNVE